VLGNLVQFHDGGGIERRELVESFHVGGCGTAAGIDEDQVGGEPASVHGHLPGPGESGFGADQVEPVGRFDAPQATATEALDDGPLTLADPAHVHLHGTGAHAEVRGSAGQIRHPGTGHHGLGGSTALVDAGAADMLTLDEGGALPAACKGPREGSPSLTGTDDDCVVPLESTHRVIWTQVEGAAGYPM
jgi:hypothetical protein